MRNLLCVAGLVLAFLSQAVNAVVITRDLAGMVVTYTGWKGNMTVTPSVANNTWNITLTDVPKFFGDNSDVTLTIRAKNKKIKDNVFIDTIRSDGALNLLKAQFSAGNKFAGCIRNIFVDGKIESLIIDGGDLGAPDGQDGHVRVNGYINNLSVKGRKFNVPKTDRTEFWGGNIWADLIVTGGIESVMLKGGSLHGYGANGTYGTVRAHGTHNMRRLIVDGVLVKTNRSDSASKHMFGGSISSYINTGRNEIRMMRVKGGSIYGSTIFCRQIVNLKILGQGLEKSRGFFSRSEQGIIASRIATASPTNIIYCKLNSISIKNGSVRDSHITAMGRVSKFLINGDVSPEMGNVSNLALRSGYVGPFSELTPPTLHLSTSSTSVTVGSTIVIPFIATNSIPGLPLTVRIHNRGPALYSMISNYAGQVYAGTNYWMPVDAVISGMFVWACNQCPAGTYTNIMLRVLDRTVPRLYSQAGLGIQVSGTRFAAEPVPGNASPAGLPVQAVTSWTYPIPTSSFAEDLRTINVIGSVRDSYFLPGIKENVSEGWEGASYLGKINNLKIKGTRYNNIFCSQKKFNIWDDDAFDFVTNTVWVNGVRRTD